MVYTSIYSIEIDVLKKTPSPNGLLLRTHIIIWMYIIKMEAIKWTNTIKCTNINIAFIIQRMCFQSKKKQSAGHFDCLILPRLCIKHILNIHHAWYEIVLHFFITTIPNSINWFKWNFRFWFLFANCNEKIEFRNVSNLRVFLNIF